MATPEKTGPWPVAHSEGPWEFDGVDRNNRRIIYNAKRSTVAYAEDFNSYDLDEEVDANARLIAAAPELLACCEDALGTLAGIYSDEDPAHVQMFDALRSAIAKAKGFTE